MVESVHRLTTAEAILGRRHAEIHTSAGVVRVLESVARLRRLLHKVASAVVHGQGRQRGKTQLRELVAGGSVVERARVGRNPLLLQEHHVVAAHHRRQDGLVLLNVHGRTLHFFGCLVSAESYCHLTNNLMN
jgi:hypothetical protein